ncbi:hypothetical protein GCM10020219_076890 [Nonomuraea dietziae]
MIDATLRLEALAKAGARRGGADGRGARARRRPDPALRLAPAIEAATRGDVQVVIALVGT